jgi:hypothetical protein
VCYTVITNYKGEKKMPNWCFQNLHVYGKTEQEVLNFVDAIKDKENDGKFSLNQLHPIPQCLNGSVKGFGFDDDKQKEIEAQEAKNKAECGYANWYDWANAEWDTKWGACDVSYEYDGTVKDGHEAIIKFESAWSPATGLIRNISSKFPTLVFSLSYTEESDAFAGVEVFVQGFCEGEFSIEPDFDDLPDQDINEDAWFDALEAKRHKIMEALDSAEDQLSEDAKKAIPSSSTNG